VAAGARTVNDLPGALGVNGVEFPELAREERRLDARLDSNALGQITLFRIQKM